MQAIRLERPSPKDSPTVSVQEVPIPKANEDHVVVKVKAAAIQPSDRLNSNGGFGNTTFPRTPGRDFAGVIVDGPPELLKREVFGTGGGLLGFGVDGAHAEYCLVHKDMFATKPPKLTYAQAAAAGVPYTTAYLCLRKARLTSTDTVLVLGATGSVGSAAVKIARALGAKDVFGAARHGNQAINLKDDPDLTGLDSLTSKKGVSIVVDTVGDLTLMTAAAKKLSPGGRYTFISAPRAPGAPGDYIMNLLDTYRRELEFIGCNSAAATPEAVGADLDTLSDLIAQGKLDGPDESAVEKVGLKQAAETLQKGKGLQVVVFGEEEGGVNGAKI